MYLYGTYSKGCRIVYNNDKVCKNKSSLQILNLWRLDVDGTQIIYQWMLLLLFEMICHYYSTIFIGY